MIWRMNSSSSAMRIPVRDSDLDGFEESRPLEPLRGETHESINIHGVGLGWG